MQFQEPSVEFIELNASDVLTYSCTTNQNARPDMEACSFDAPHGSTCPDDDTDWYCADGVEA